MARSPPRLPHIHPVYDARRRADFVHAVRAAFRCCPVPAGTVTHPFLDLLAATMPQRLRASSRDRMLPVVREFSDHE